MMKSVSTGSAPAFVEIESNRVRCPLALFGQLRVSLPEKFHQRSKAPDDLE